MNAADTSWILTATALVLLMTLPGLALFYAGLVQSKNILSVLMQCMAVACAASVLWFAIGYTIAFSDGNGWTGGPFKNVPCRHRPRKAFLVPCPNPSSQCSR